MDNFPIKKSKFAFLISTIFFILCITFVSAAGDSSSFTSLTQRENYIKQALTLNPDIVLNGSSGGSSPPWINLIRGKGGGGNYTWVTGAVWNGTTGTMAIAGGTFSWANGQSNLTSPFINEGTWNGTTISIYLNLSTCANQYIFDARDSDLTPRLSIARTNDSRLAIFQLQSNYAGNSSNITWQGEGGDGKLIRTIPNAMPCDSLWHRYDWRFRGSNETWEFYRDAVLNDSNEIAGNGVGVFGNFSSLPRWGATLNITSDLNPRWGRPHNFSGEVNTHLMWGRALGDGELNTMWLAVGLVNATVEDSTSNYSALTQTNLNLTAGAIALLLLVAITVVCLQLVRNFGKLNPEQVITMFIIIFIMTVLTTILIGIVLD